MEMMMAELTTDKDDLAKVLVSMPFGRLMEIAHELVSMVADADVDRKIDTPVGMAEMLYDWADAQDESK
jgi:hypothetical protein